MGLLKKKTDTDEAKLEDNTAKDEIVTDEAKLEVGDKDLYVVTKKSFINNQIHEVGSLVRYTGKKVGKNLEPYTPKVAADLKSDREQLENG